MNTSKELLVMVADNLQEEVIRTLIKKRYKSLKIQEVNLKEPFLRPGTDGTVRRKAHTLLRPYRNTNCYALIVLDCAFDNAEPYLPSMLREEIGKNLIDDGWRGDQFEVVPIFPEIEIWAWVKDSPKLEIALKSKWNEIYGIIRSKCPSYWPPEMPKPVKPKELLKVIQKEKHIPHSPGLAQKLIDTKYSETCLGLDKCNDPSFKLFTEALQRWYGE